MTGLSILLFWLPILGPAVAGLVGGYFAGTVGRAILASLMPAVVLAVLILLVGTAFDPTGGRRVGQRCNRPCDPVGQLRWQLMIRRSAP